MKNLQFLRWKRYPKRDHFRTNLNFWAFAGTWSSQEEPWACSSTRPKRLNPLFFLNLQSDLFSQRWLESKNQLKIETNIFWKVVQVFLRQIKTIWWLPLQETGVHQLNLNWCWQCVWKERKRLVSIMLSGEEEWKRNERKNLRYQSSRKGQPKDRCSKDSTSWALSVFSLRRARTSRYLSSSQALPGSRNLLHLCVMCFLFCVLCFVFCVLLPFTNFIEDFFHFFAIGQY